MPEDQATNDSTAAYWVSPHFVSSDFGEAPTLEQVVLLFVDGVWGWQLDQAERLLQASAHAGLAALSVVVSYFEMIEQYREGILGAPGTSRTLFSDGVRWVLGDTGTEEAREMMIERLWHAVRNGLYHDALVREGVVLSGELKKGVVMETRPAPDGRVELAINPHALVRELQRHFAAYVVSLLDPGNAEVRDAFMRRLQQGAAGN